MTKRYYGTDAPRSTGPHPDPLAAMQPGDTPAEYRALADRVEAGETGREVAMPVSDQLIETWCIAACAAESAIVNEACERPVMGQCSKACENCKRIGRVAITAVYPAIREAVLREAAEHLRSDPHYDQGDMHARRLLALAQQGAQGREDGHVEK